MAEHATVATTESGWDRRCYASFCRWLESLAAATAEASLLRRPGVVAAISPRTPDRSLFNSVAYERPAALADAVDDLRSAYRGAGVRAWTVWTPAADRHSARLLERRGHRLDGEPRSMLADLGSIPGPDRTLDYTRGLSWRELCRVNEVAYDVAADEFARGMGTRPPAGARAYGARHEGWLASVLATILHERDCGVYWVATLPEARGNRLASGLLHRALLDAREAGCETSTLQSSAMGRSVYARLGYEDLGALQMWEHRVFPG
jgi:GNAT superfamily N-acetyltransferase